MSVTVKIENTGVKADSIIKMLKAPAEDYDFLKILDDTELPTLSEEEFQKRYNYTIENMEEGQSWAEVKKELFSDEEI